MLVLTRKRDEMITIGTDIVIRVIKTGKGSVKIGIEAPASVRVRRGEMVTTEVQQTVSDVDDYVGEEFEDCAIEAMLMQN